VVIVNDRESRRLLARSIVISMIDWPIIEGDIMDTTHIAGVCAVGIPVQDQDDAIRFFRLTDGHE
jgi:hypothetical protein